MTILTSKRVYVGGAAIAALALLAVGGTAVAARLGLMPYEVNADEPAHVDSGPPDNDWPIVSPEERAILDAASEREAAIVAELSPAALFQRAAEAKYPPILGEALASLDDSAKAGLSGLTHLPLEDSGWSPGAELRSEEVGYSSGGRGIVMVSFQDWPSNVDPQILIGEDFKVEKLGRFDVASRHDALTPAVTVFDGALAVHVYAWHEPTITVDEARALAIALFDEIARNNP